MAEKETSKTEETITEAVCEKQSDTKVDISTTTKEEASQNGKKQQVKKSITQEKGKKEPRRKPRARKKRLHQRIRAQMEFYFSDANLSRDQHMMALLQDGITNPISLTEFMEFNKIKKLTSDINDLVKSLEQSSIVMLSADKTTVRRNRPVECKPDKDECTIYVENLPPLVTREWLSEVFSHYGVVVYVALPMNKRTGKPKGCSFVEFDKKEMAENVLRAFGASGCTIPVHNVEDIGSKNNTEESVTTQKDEEKPEQITEEVKEVSDENKPDDVGEQTAKRKLEYEGNESESKKLKTNENRPVSEEDTQENKKQKSEESIPASGAASSDISKKKVKKRRRRIKKIKPDNEVESLGLQVMSKSEWKRLRDRYLELQRSNMANTKASIKRAQANIGEQVEEKMVPEAGNQVSLGDSSVQQGVGNEAWRKHGRKRIRRRGRNRLMGKAIDIIYQLSNTT